MNTQSFQIQGGYCHLFADRIEIEPTTLGGKLARQLSQWGINRYSWFYGFLALLLLGAALMVLLIENYLLAVFLGIMAVYQGYLLWKKRDHTIQFVMPRDQVQHVTYRPAVEGLARASFIMLVGYPGKTALKRIISLPSARYGGASIAQTAQLLFQEGGWGRNEE